MSFPLLVLPSNDEITEARLAAEKAAANEPRHRLTDARIRELQYGTRKGEALSVKQVSLSLMSSTETLSEKPLPCEKPLPGKPLETANSSKAWTKVMETLQPARRKQRRAKEFDAMMRREIENPVGDIEAGEWTAVVSHVGIDKSSTMTGREATMTDRGNWSSALNNVKDTSENGSATEEQRDDGIGSETTGNAEYDSVFDDTPYAYHDMSDRLSLRSAIRCLMPEEKEEEITALPRVPEHLLSQAPKKKEPKKLRKTRSNMHSNTKSLPSQAPTHIEEKKNSKKAGSNMLSEF